MTKQVRIEVRSVGQAFACRGIVRDARTGRKLAETRVMPHGFDAAALTAAEAMAAERGWQVAS